MRDMLWKQEGQTTLPNNRSGLPKNYLVFGVLLLVCALASGGLAYYYYSMLGKVQNQDRSQSANVEANLIKEVSKLIVLPQDEQPTIATVVDPEQLKNQTFFAHAKKGDKVLIYTKAKKAILYDPVNHKIVEVAPLNIGNTAGIKTETSK